MYPNGLVAAASIASHTSTPSSRPNIASSFIQRDVHVPEGVLDELGQLCLARRGHRHGPVHDAPVEVLHRGQRGVVDARHDLRRRGQGPGPVPGVDALRAVAEVEVGARGQPGPVFKPRQHLLLRGPRVGRGLHDHRGARAQVPGQRAAGRLDVGQVGQAVPQRRGDRDHGDVEAGAGVGTGRRPEPPGFQRRRELAAGTSSTYDSPASSRFTRTGSMSYPVTSCPAATARIASGRPTYPRPATTTALTGTPRPAAVPGEDQQLASRNPRQPAAR